MDSAGSPSHSQTPPLSKTLDLPNSSQSLVVQNSQQSDEHEDAPSIPVADVHQSGKPHPKSIVLTDDTENRSTQSAPPVMSPTNLPRPFNKRKKPGARKTYKRKRPEKKIQTLTDKLIPIPFVPAKKLDLDKHEEVLKRLGLYQFSKIEFDSTLRTDLIIQLIMCYDPKKRCSYVNDSRINVNRADLARALKLPAAKQDKGSSSIEEVDLDSEVFSDEAIGFIEDFVFNSMLLDEESRNLPAEIMNWIRCIRDGHPEKLDSASLIWYKVEKELTQGDKLVHCYYASHLQYLIRSQKDSLFWEDGGGDDEEPLIAYAAREDQKQNEEKDEREVKTQKEQDQEQNEEKDEKEVKTEKEQEQEQEQNEEKDEKEVKTEKEQEQEQNEEKDEKQVKIEKEQEQSEAKDEKEVKTEKDNEQELEQEEQKEKVSTASTFQEQSIELTLGADVEEPPHEEVKKEDESEAMVDVEEPPHEEVKKEDESEAMVDVEEPPHEEVKEEDETMVDAEECKEEVQEMEEQGSFLQRCQSSDLNNFEEIKVEEVDDEQIEQVEDEDEEQDQDQDQDEGFDMEANDNSFDRDGLTGNFLQGVETSHHPYNSHGMSSMDLFGSRAGPFMSPGGPSFYNNVGKRVIEPEENDEDIHHLQKRLKTDDLTFCFDQMHELMQKAKMIHESKERSYENLHYNQQMEMGQLQERQQLMEMIIKSKDEELEKKHAEVFRLERELYLMGDLLSGYRKALHDTRFKFSEYRKRAALQEEPVYKDVGPGGLVLSTREIEKQRLKQEEDMVKIQFLLKNFEEECVYQLDLQNERLLPLVDKLKTFENEVQRLKEFGSQLKETREPSAELAGPVETEENRKSLDEIGSSVEPEEDQKVKDEITEKDLDMESVPLDADDSEGKGDGEEH